MNDARDRLLAAVAADDWISIRELGWEQVFVDLRSFWPKRFGTDDALSYARLLGNHDAAVVHAAMLTLAVSGEAEWRPSPAQLATVAGQRATSKQASKRPRPDEMPATLALVAELVEGGELECGCRARPCGRLAISAGVVRCTTCGGLDAGQVDRALEAATA